MNELAHSSQIMDFLSDILRQLVLRPLGHIVSRIGLETIGAAFFCLFVCTVFLLAIIKPEYNWDMAAYLASAMQSEFASDIDLHRQVWSVMQTNASENQFYTLSAGNPYNLYNYENPSAFVSMSPMYDVKIAYIAIIRLLGPIVGYANAANWISAVSVLLVGCTCLFWMSSRKFLQAAPIVIMIMLLSGYLYMGRIVTPDLIVAACFLAGAERFVRGKGWLAISLFIMAFLFRPDTIVFIFALLLAVVVFRERRIPYIVGFLATVVVSVWLSSAPEHPGWWAHFWFSCVEIQNTMIGFDPDFSIAVYLKGIARGIMVSLKHNNWPMLLGLLVIAWGLLAAAGREPDRRGTVFLVSILLAFAGKFTVFPLPDDRLYMPLIVAFAMILLEAWKPEFNDLFARLPSPEIK